MKNECQPIDSSISFSDASLLFLNYQADNEILEVVLTAWNEQVVRILFEGVAYFTYKSGDFISDILQYSEESQSFKETLKKAEVNSQTDNLKLIKIKNIDDKPLLEVLCIKLVLS